MKKLPDNQKRRDLKTIPELFKIILTGDKEVALHTQLTDTVVMVAPKNFGFNPQTAQTNPFQRQLKDSAEHVQQEALKEFNAMVGALTAEDIRVLVLPSREDVITPDSIFPNNWFSHHSDGKLVIYPMLAQNRRDERQANPLALLLKKSNISISEIIDLTVDEKKGDFWEGTGSLVLDRVNKVAFAMESPRTTKKEFDKWCALMEYEGVLFHAYDAKKFPIYHTNVTMNLGQEFAVICMESIVDADERAQVEKKLGDFNKDIISFTVDQIDNVCGNVLQVLSTDGEPKIIMSESALRGFHPDQIQKLEKYGKIIAVKIPTIEAIGGGSARCMLAEIFHI